MHRVLITLLLFLFSSACLQAQNYETIAKLEKALIKYEDNDSVKLVVLSLLIKQTATVQTQKEMWGFMQQELELATEANSAEGLVNSLYNHGIFFYHFKNQPDSALPYFYKGLVMAGREKIKQPEKRMGRFHGQIGLIYKNKYEYDSAFHHYNQTDSLFKTTDLLLDPWRLNLKLSRLYTVVGNQERALEHAFACLDIARRHSEKYNKDELIHDTNALIAEKYYDQRSYESALRYIDKTIPAWKEDPASKDSDLHALYELKAKCFLELERFGEAEELFLKNLNFLADAFGDSHAKLVYPLNSLARLYLKTGRFEQSSEYVSRALRISEQYDNRWHLDILQIQSGLYQAAGQYEKALDILRESLEFDGHNSGNSHKSYRRMAEICRLTGDWEQSVEYCDKSIMPAASGDTFNFSLSAIGKNWNNVSLVLKKASVLEELAKETQNEKDLERSLRSYQLGDSMILEMRNLYKQQSDEIDFNALFSDMYKGGIRTAAKLYQLTKNSRYLKLAFYFSEKAKASVLHKSVVKNREVLFSSIPDSIIRSDQDLRNKIEFYQSRLMSITDSSRIVQFENKLFNARRDYEKLLIQIEHDYPEYHRLKYHKSYADISGVMRALTDQTLIEYALDETNAAVFVINRSGAKLEILSIPENLDSLVINFRHSIVTQDLKLSQAYGRELYNILFAPLEDHIGDEQITIVPDGILWHLNFDLLRKGDSKDVGDYLLAHYAIGYANSANLLLETSHRGSKAETACLAFSYADSVMNSKGETIDFLALRAHDAELPGTRREINNIASIIPGRYYYGKEANEKNFKEAGNDYAILHLAVHGEIDDIEPNNSKLKFVESETDTLEDNYLHAFELYNMKLNAEMAVLSACNSGDGALVNGEGIMSLGRAFQYAGVKSMVISNWEVVDEVAPELMTFFYRNLKSGMTKSQALRKAKLAYLKSAGPNRQHPYFWSSFVIIGDNSPVFRSYDNFYYLAAAVLLTVVASVSSRRMKWRKEHRA